MFFQLTEAIEVQASSQSISVYTTDVFLSEVFLGLFGKDLRHVLSSVLLLCGAKEKNKGLLENRCIQGHSSRVSGALCICVCTRLSLFIQVTTSDT